MRVTALVLGCAVATVSASSAPVPSGAAKLVEKALASKTGEETVTHGSVTMLKSDVPEDAEDWWPWESLEDFFRYSGLSQGDLVASGVQKCSSPSPNKMVYTVSDGENERCFIAVRPSAKKEKLPVLFYAHGSGGSAYQCGGHQDLTGKSWLDVAETDNFIMACGEAVQTAAVNNITGATLQGGIWSLPEVFNDSSGRHCGDDPNLEMKYMNAVYAKMREEEYFDMTKLFFHGCSEGSAFTQWQGVCQHQAEPANVSALATHSTGLKVKGDGNEFPPCHVDPQYTWGECPTCKYWPTVPGKFDGLKACIFDNTADPNMNDPLFYRSSEQMATYYKQEGSRYVTSFGSGGHCVQHSFDAIAECMDDGTGRLISSGGGGGNCTDIAPDNNYTCAQQASLGKCDRKWMDGYCCKTCFDCSASCSN